jgi:hypothetical protein
MRPAAAGQCIGEHWSRIVRAQRPPAVDGSVTATRRDLRGRAGAGRPAGSSHWPRPPRRSKRPHRPSADSRIRSARPRGCVQRPPDTNPAGRRAPRRATKRVRCSAGDRSEILEREEASIERAGPAAAAPRTCRRGDGGRDWTGRAAYVYVRGAVEPSPPGACCAAHPGRSQKRRARAPRNRNMPVRLPLSVSQLDGIGIGKAPAATGERPPHHRSTHVRARSLAVGAPPPSG